MPRQIGSQLRATLKESGYVLVRREPGRVILQAPDGQREAWYANDHHAGYTVQVGRWGYEFAHDVTE